MLRAVLADFRSNWRALFVTDIIMKGIAFAILTPLVSLAFDAFLAISGRSVLADADIALFFLHPVGWLTAVIVGGGVLAVFAIEQATLMTIVVARDQGDSIGAISSLRFVASRSWGVFQIMRRFVAHVLLVAAPFLAFGGVVYLMLLTKHDINFYLTEKPPVFWLAVVAIGAIVAMMASVLLHLVSGCVFAIQLYLFENMPPSECLRASKRLAEGDRARIVGSILVWMLGNVVASGLVAGLVAVVGQNVIGFAAASLWSVVIAVGVLLIVWSLLNVLVNALTFITLSIVLVRLYTSTPHRLVKPLDLRLSRDGSIAIKLTPGRVLAIVAIGFVVSLTVAANVIQGTQLEDNVQITAHRGASAKAPENTLAAVKQAIADKTDWVEVDVQESRDGIVIVAHDSDLKKVGGADTKIWDATADELRSVDIGSYFDPKFADERVPTLTEVLEACRGKAKLTIELKYYGHDQELEQRVVDLVEKSEMAQDIIIMSLESKGIQKIKQLRPDWTVGLLTAVAVGDLTRADADFFAVSTKLATPGFIRAAHQKGKTVSVWTVNDAITMSVMISRGVDNLITDHPDLARKVLAERAMMSPVERLMLELASYLQIR